jgi:hypothetical protein
MFVTIEPLFRFNILSHEQTYENALYLSEKLCQEESRFERGLHYTRESLSLRNYQKSLECGLPSKHASQALNYALVRTMTHL